jgi:hypothetical protein
MVGKFHPAHIIIELSTMLDEEFFEPTEKKCQGFFDIPKDHKQQWKCNEIN